MFDFLGDDIMFIELESDNEFKRRYFEMLKYRLAFSSLELEEIKDNIANFHQSMQIYNQLQAINYIFGQHHADNMTHMEFTGLLCEIAKKVTGDEISNFRTTEAIVSGSKIERTKPSYIRNDLWYLLDNYNYQIENCKTDEELYEIEAMAHIKLLHIHPFDDGNGRTARILLAYNMCKNNLAPCIITKEIKRKYCDLVENSDYKGMALLIEELEIMLSLYKELDSLGLINNDLMTKKQEEAYKLLKKK